MAIVVNCAERTGRPSPLPRLFVRTVSVPAPVRMTEHIPATPSALWLHGTNGAVAVGEIVRLEASGPHRFACLSDAFCDIADAAHVTDDVRARGTGLTAFGSFSYADTSVRASRLLIPEVILGMRDGEAFLTFISTAPLGDIDDEQISGTLLRFTPSARIAAPHVDMTPAHSPEAYRALVGEAVHRIERGDALKVVLSERFDVDLGDLNAHTLIPGLARVLNERFPGAWTYYLDDIIGASPEMLVRTDGDALFSRVLAGSRPVASDSPLSEDERQAFQQDPKERSEHDFAVQSVTEPLADLTTQLTASPEPFVLQLRGIEHLASDVSATLKPGVRVLDAAYALHPSAAVSGTPRADANRIIAELEKTDRGGYAAPVGWINANGDGEWAIALRMAHINETSVTLQAGAGLVHESDPLTEHAEAIAKTRPVMGALMQL